jgi:hypothetical protein
VATAVVETVEPTAEPTAVPTVVPTPTADPLDLLRSRIHELLGDPYEAESFRAENAKTPDEEAALLAAVPLADRAEFAHDYLILPTALDNLSDLHNFVEDPVMCAATPPNGPMYIVVEDPVVYNFTDNPEAIWHLWFPQWGPLPPELNREEYVVLYCGDKPAAHEEIEHHRELLQQRRVDEEERAEAIFSEMVRDVIHDSLGVDFPVQLAFNDEYFAQILVYDADGQVVDSLYFDREATVGHRGALEELFQEDLGYDFSFRLANEFSLSSAPSVPVAVFTADSLYTLKDMANGAVRQLIRAYPLGNGTGNDGQTIAETFAIVAGRELFRRFLETNYTLQARFAGLPCAVISWRVRRERLALASLFAAIRRPRGDIREQLAGSGRLRPQELRH